MARFGDMCKEIYLNNLPIPDSINSARKIEFEVGEGKGNDAPTLLTNPYGFILISAISRAVLQNILSILESPELESKLEERAKNRLRDLASEITKCDSCGYGNHKSADYCKKCGSKLSK